MNVSAEYKEITEAEVQGVMDSSNAWIHPEMPERQYNLVVQGEIERFRKGDSIAPYDALIQCLSVLDPELNTEQTKLLDVGASSAYYSEVLKIAGYRYSYTGLDCSEAYKELAVRKFNVNFDVGDARELPYTDSSFDIVLHGACIMHCPEFEKAISEAVRVSSRYVIFHRTPIYLGYGPHRYFEKEAYGFRCLEIHFNEIELLQSFARGGLNLIRSMTVFFDWNKHFGHVSYLLEKCITTAP